MYYGKTKKTSCEGTTQWDQDLIDGCVTLIVDRLLVAQRAAEEAWVETRPCTRPPKKYREEILSVPNANKNDSVGPPISLLATKGTLTLMEGPGHKGDWRLDMCEEHDGRLRCKHYIANGPLVAGAKTLIRKLDYAPANIEKVVRALDAFVAWCTQQKESRMAEADATVTEQNEAMRRLRARVMEAKLRASDEG